MEKLKYEQKKCKSCGSNLIFSPSNCALLCKNCSSTYPITKNSNYEKHILDESVSTKQKVDEWASQNKVMQCQNCGAQIVLNKLEYAKECPYCGNAVVNEVSALPGLKPDAVIPFKFDGVEAVQKFNFGVRKKWFLPNEFKRNLPKSEMNGTYIASFSFDTNTFSTYSGVFTYTKTSRDSEGHSHSETVRVPVSGTHNERFVNVIIEANQHISTIDYEGIKPYNLGEAVSFDEDYLRGYTVEHYSDDMNTCFNQAKAQILASIKSELPEKHGCTSIESIKINTDYRDKKYCYYLLPTYMFVYKYKEKIYKTLMNGQTGKVGSNVPRSKVKITFFVLGIILLFLLIVVGVKYLDYLSEPLDMLKF